MSTATWPTELFRWVPGQAADPRPLARLRDAFPPPNSPMGEAWFMGERRKMFTQLQGDLNLVAALDLREALVEIASGTSSFGQMSDEWPDWFHHLLGWIVPRAHDGPFYSLLETLVTAFISQYPDGMTDARYPGFSSDALATLGCSLMDAECWTDGRMVAGGSLHHSRPWGWFDVAGAFSASMIFCLKYLPAAAIGPWMESVLAIECPRWRAKVIAWLVGAHDVLNGHLRQPSDFGAASPPIEWDWSHCLSGNYTGDLSGRVAIGHLLPIQNRVAALEAVSRALSADVLLDWLSRLEEADGLEGDLDDLAVRVLDFYVRPVGQGST